MFPRAFYPWSPASARGGRPTPTPALGFGRQKLAGRCVSQARVPGDAQAAAGPRAVHARGRVSWSFPGGHRPPVPLSLSTLPTGPSLQPPLSPYLAAHCTPRPEGSGAGPGAEAGLRPPRCRSLSAPLPPPAAQTTLSDPADLAGPGDPSLPAAEPSPLPPRRRRLLGRAPRPAIRGGDPPAQRLSLRSPRPRSSPAAVTPPKGLAQPGARWAGDPPGSPSRVWGKRRLGALNRNPP